MARRRLVAVIGAGVAADPLSAHAHDVGALVASAGHALVTGGLGGVMEAASRGYASVGSVDGLVLGWLPGSSTDEANPFVDVAVPTGLGIGRNLLVVRSAAAVIAVGGEAGTLSEIALAWQEGRPICGFAPAGGWGARVAGTALDGRPRDPIAVAQTLAELERWLGDVLDPR